MAADLAELTRVARAAEQMLRTLVTAPPEELVRALRPLPEDYARVFVPTVAEQAERGFAAMWSAPPRSLGKPHQTEVHALAATAAMLREDSPVSREFPGGYRGIAHLLQPGVVWVRWKMVAPGESSGMALDGLVQLGERWAWFPKPWRVIADPDVVN